jgi:hypothetical protein
MNRPRPRDGAPVRARAGAAGTIPRAEPSWPCLGRTAARQIRVRRCCPSGDPQPGTLRAKVAARPRSARSRPYPPRRPGPSTCGNRGISRCCRHDCLPFAVLAVWLVPPGVAAVPSGSSCTHAPAARRRALATIGTVLPSARRTCTHSLGSASHEGLDTARGVERGCCRSRAEGQPDQPAGLHYGQRRPVRQVRAAGRRPGPPRPRPARRLSVPPQAAARRRQPR